MHENDETKLPRPTETVVDRDGERIPEVGRSILGKLSLGNVLAFLKVSEGDNARLVVNTESLVGNGTSATGSETLDGGDRSRPLAISSLNLNSIK